MFDSYEKELRYSMNLVPILLYTIWYRDQG